MASAPATELKCVRCGSSQTVPAYDPARTYRCAARDCGGDLVDPAEAKTVRADTPAEVSRAAADPRNRIGKYVLLRELGRGGMGAVYKAWDTSLKRWLALKFLILPGNDEDLQRFRREAQTAAALKHPNIAAIYEVGESDGKPFIAMEFVEGRSLQGLKLKVPRACQVMHQVALALSYAHGRSIIHRDLKPANILLDDEDKPTVLDFGLAKSLTDASRLTVSGMVVGTPCYMSPEQAEGRASEVGSRSDVYQLGAVLYELVTGRPPFRGDNAAQILLRVIEEDLVPPSRLASVPSDVETIVLRAMEKEPRKRYPSAKAFADDLERFLHGEGIIARRASTYARMKRVIRRHKPLAAATVAALLLLLAGGAWLSQRASAREDHVRQGDARFAQRNYQTALEFYSRALELDPGSAEIQQKLQECRRHLKLADDKARAAEEARVRAEKAAAEEKRLAAARESSRAGYERGLGELDEAVKDLYRQGADLVRMRERLLTAITAFTESLSKWPENPEALYARGRARALRFDVEDADKDFARAVELRPAFPAAQTDRAKLLLQQYIEAKMHAGWRWSEEVERPYKRWKDLAKSVSADAAWVAFAEDRMNDALRLCEERLKEKPEQEELWKMAGDTLFLSMGSVEGGNPDPRQGVMIQRAIQAYTEAIRLRPNYYEARMMRGYVLSQGGEFKQGAVDIGVALRLRPDDALACWLMGRAVNDPSKALEWYDRGLKTHPDSFICRMNRAASLGQTGRYPEALAEIDRSVRLNPSHYYPVYLRASIRSMQGDMESCFQDSKKVVEMAPDFQSGWFNLGASAFNTKRWREAIAAMERALQLGMADRTAAEDTIRKAKRQLGE